MTPRDGVGRSAAMVGRHRARDGASEVIPQRFPFSLLLPLFPFLPLAFVSSPSRLLFLRSSRLSPLLSDDVAPVAGGVSAHLRRILRGGR